MQFYSFCLEYCRCLLPISGSKLIWGAAKQLLPQLQGELSTGSLVSGFTVTGAGWADKKVSLVSNHTTIDWLPSELLAGELAFESIEIQKLSIVADTSTRSPETTSQPSYDLPISLDIKQLSIKGIDVSRGSTHETIDTLQLKAQLQHSHLTISELYIAHPDIQANIHGQITLSDLYPASLDIRLIPEQLPEAISSSPVIATLEGHWPEYQLTAETQITTPRELNIDVSVHSSLTSEQLNIHNLRLNSSSHGEINTQGLLSWQNALVWRGESKLEGLDLSIWFSEVSSRLDGSVTSNFSQTGDSTQLELTPINIVGIYLGKPAQISGSLSTSDYHSWSLEQLKLAVADNVASIHGQISESLHLHAEVNAPDLSDLYPGIQGDLSGAVALSGQLKQPVTDFHISSKNLSYGGTTFSGIKAEGTSSHKDQLSGKAVVNIAEASFEHRALQDIQLSVSGNEASHLVQLTGSGEQLNINLAAEGHAGKSIYRSTLNQLSLQTDIGLWQLKNPVLLSFDENRFSYQNVCLKSNSASLCLKDGEWTADQRHLTFDLINLDTVRLASLLPDHLNWQANLNASGSVQWLDKRPVCQFKVLSSPGQINLGEQTQSYEKLEAKGSLYSDILSFSGNFSSQQLGESELDLTIQHLSTSRDLSGRLNVSDFKLKTLSPFFPNIENLSGDLTAKAEIAGTRKSPLLYGRVTLAEGALNLSGEIPAITRLETELLANGHSGTLQGALTINNSRLYIGGDLSWQHGYPFHGHLKIHGQDIPVLYPGYGSLTLSPDLVIKLDKRPNVSGSINIPSAQIIIKQLSNSAVQISDDTIVYNSDKSEAEQKAGSDYRLNVDLKLGEDVKLNAYGLSTNLTGQLSVKKDIDQEFEGKGSIGLKDGRYHQFGQDLIIKKGKVVFQGPLNSPYLQIDAIRNPETIEDNVTVGINITGLITQPEWTLFSVPVMSKQEQLSYLLKGRSVNDPEETSLESLAISAGIGQLGDFTSSLGSALGIDSLTLEAEGSGDNTQITIGGYVAHGLRIQYQTGVFNSIGEIKARYELLPRLYLQIVSGLDQAVDLFYRFSLPSDQSGSQ